MIRQTLCTALEWFADAIHFFSLALVAVIFASWTVAPGGSLPVAFTASLLILGFNYLVARPMGRRAARALGK